MTSPKTLFLLSFVAIIFTYSIVLGEVKTVSIILNEYIFILLTIPLFFTLLYYKQKLKTYELIDFNKNNTPSLKSTIGFFLFFQVIDFIYEDGFIGMISQWFMYWIMGLIALLIIEIVNYHRNYKIISLQK